MDTDLGDILFAMKKLGLLMLILGLLTQLVVAQTPKNGEQSFRDAILKKQRYLRDFNADAEVRWRWNGAALVPSAPKAHMLGVLIADSIKIKDSKIEIRGERHTLLQNKDATLVLSKTMDTVRVEVDLAGADIASVLPKLADLLFYSDRESALADLPNKYEKVLPIKVDSDCCSSKKPEDKNCDCANLGAANCTRESPTVGMIGMKPPRPIRIVDPEFSKEARQAKFSGIVQVGLDVDASGHPQNVWIIRSVGLGLDTKAANSVNQYIFAPATCHDHPVPVALYVDVNFQIF